LLNLLEFGCETVTRRKDACLHVQECIYSRLSGLLKKMKEKDDRIEAMEEALDENLYRIHALEEKIEESACNHSMLFNHIPATKLKVVVTSFNAVKRTAC